MADAEVTVALVLQWALKRAIWPFERLLQAPRPPSVRRAFFLSQPCMTTPSSLSWPGAGDAMAAAALWSGGGGVGGARFEGTGARSRRRDFDALGLRFSRRGGLPITMALVSRGYWDQLPVVSARPPRFFATRSSRRPGSSGAGPILFEKLD